MAKPIVSILIPVYNVENYLEKCLDSVISQTMNNIEIICVNDGSTDHSGEILENIKRKINVLLLLTKKWRVAFCKECRVGNCTWKIYWIC